MNISVFRNNNFDLIRLFAASQVIFFNHYMEYFKLDFLRGSFMEAFPGVPIFFFISGFLISASYERKNDISVFFTNRVLRIFPALWVCLLVSVFSVWVAGYPIFENMKNFSVWFLSQLFFPVYNPAFMRGYGVGVLDGSLWTIPVEMSFYFCLPVFYFAFGLGKGLSGTWRVLFLILFFFFFTYGLKIFMPELFELKTIYSKLFGVSPIPHLYLFLTGVLFQRGFGFFHKILAGRFIWIVIIYIAAYYAMKAANINASLVAGKSWVQLPMAWLLAACVFSAAYTKCGLSFKLLRGHDISYGVYIYHMPAANFMLYVLTPQIGYAASFIAAVAATYSVASLSWFFVERPCLELKKYSLNPFKRK